MYKRNTYEYVSMYLPYLAYKNSYWDLKENTVEKFNEGSRIYPHFIFYINIFRGLKSFCFFKLECGFYALQNFLSSILPVISTSFQHHVFQYIIGFTLGRPLPFLKKNYCT